MFDFNDFLNVLDEDMSDIYFEIYDHHNREIFYGHGTEIPENLKTKTVKSVSTIDAGCYKIVLYRSILSDDENVTTSWKQDMIYSVYNHIKQNELAGTYDENLTDNEFIDHMISEIQTLISDYSEDNPGTHIDWKDLESDCKYYVSCVTTKLV